MHRLNSLLTVVIAAATMQGTAPATDVFLAPLSGKDDQIRIGKPINISNGPGYDNQPSFTADGRTVLFTSVRGDRTPAAANSAQTGSDIYGYEIASGRLTQLTTTAESEYSPTVTPDGKHFSVIQVESDDTQRLWKFPLSGGKAELVLTDIKPVGYHAWADATTLVLFVLGSPATLQVADVKTGKSTIVAKDIGRSIQRIPGGGVSFVQREVKDGTTTLSVMQLDTRTGEKSTLVPVMPGMNNPEITWTPDGTMLVAHAGKLHGWRRGQSEFKVVADLDGLGLRGVSRLATSPRGDHIAIVAQQ